MTLWAIEEFCLVYMGRNIGCFHDEEVKSGGMAAHPTPYLCGGMGVYSICRGSSWYELRVPLA